MECAAEFAIASALAAMKTTFVSLAVLCAAAGGASAQRQSDLFDGSVLHEVRLTVHPGDWQKLRDNYLDNTYYPAALQWGSLVVEEVAIRSRGLGSRSYDKPGLRVDFNRYTPGREFLGLKSLVLDNVNQDKSYMAERLSMEMFRRMGIPAPRVVHAKLFINDAYFGLYAMVEPVDKGFLSRNLGEDGGYLYDYEWVGEYWFDYLGPEPGRYTPEPFSLQTNESRPNPAPLVDMIRVLNESSADEFTTRMAQYLDLQRVATYLAVEAFIAEYDGLAGDWGANNFYVYGRQGSDRFEFLPWDKDLAFRREHVQRSISANADRHVLLRRLLDAPELRQHYFASLERCMEIAGGSGGWLETEIERIYAQIRTAALEDPQKNFSFAEFEEAVEGLRAFAFERPAEVSSQLRGAR
jgi:spore coat protein CotH